MPNQWTGISLRERFEAQHTKADGCWLWTGVLNAYGYGMLRDGNGGKRLIRAHRLAYELFVGPIPDGLWVLHSCDVRSCVNPEHLHLGTTYDNMREAVERKRMRRGATHRNATHPWTLKRGEASHFAKLTADQVLEIRRLRNVERLKLTDIAPRYGITFQLVSHIALGKVWRHLA